jgi:hypothetical protein
LGKKRTRAGAELTHEQQVQQLLRLFNMMFEQHGVMPDTLRGQNLEFFLAMRLTENSEPLVFPESVDWT